MVENNGKKRGLRGFGIVAAENVRPVVIVLGFIGGIIGYFFISQASQDAAAANTKERVTAVESVVQAQEKTIDEIKNHAEERRSEIQGLQQGVTKIQTTQEAQGKFLGEQLKQIQSDLKVIRGGN